MGYGDLTPQERAQYAPDVMRMIDVARMSYRPPVGGPGPSPQPMEVYQEPKEDPLKSEVRELRSRVRELEGQLRSVTEAQTHSSDVPAYDAPQEPEKSPVYGELCYPTTPIAVDLIEYIGRMRSSKIMLSSNHIVMHMSLPSQGPSNRSLWNPDEVEFAIETLYNYDEALRLHRFIHRVYRNKIDYLMRREFGI